MTYEINTQKAVFFTEKECIFLQYEEEFGGLDGKRFSEEYRWEYATKYILFSPMMLDNFVIETNFPIKRLF
jgi:hypothetical protein